MADYNLTNNAADIDQALQDAVALVTPLAASTTSVTAYGDNGNGVTAAEAATAIKGAKDGNIGNTPVSPSADLSVAFLPDGCSFQFVSNPIDGPAGETSGYVIDLGSSGSSINSQIFVSNFSNKLYYRSSTASAWREIYNTGNVGSTTFGTGSPSAGDESVVISQGGNGRIDLARTGTTTATLLNFINGNGAVGTIQTSGTSTSYNTSSDNRLKTVLSKPTDAEINKKFNDIFDCFTLFDWKSGSNDTPVWGFLAHDVIDKGLDFGSEGEGSRTANIGDVYQEATYDEDGNELTPELRVTPAGVDQSKVVPYLVAKIEQLERRLKTLEGI